MKPNTPMPDEDLFEQNTEQWLRKYKPHWSDERIEEELRTIRLMSLLDFYEEAIKLYPDLKDRLPLLPPVQGNKRKRPDLSQPHNVG
ncbi:MAG TPA: hypothetical protein VGE45_00170 [Chloroflexia bacterium]